MNADSSPLRWRGSVLLAVLATACFAAAALWAPARRVPATRVYVLVLGAIVVRQLVRVVAGFTRVGPLPFDRALRASDPGAPNGPEELRAIARLVGASTHRALELHYLLRPRLRAIATDRLASRHGVKLDADAEEARGALGEEAWALLRAEREAPEDRFGPGAPLEQLERIVHRLEAL
jgi:hypothetical protein